MRLGREGRYELRTATVADHEFLVRAHHTGLRPSIERTWGWDEVAQDAFAREWLAGRDDDTQIVGVAGEDAGYLVLHRGRDPWYLSSIVLMPAFQGSGLGTALLGDLLEETDAAGMRVDLQVMKVNPARRLYERLGFAATDETEHHTLMRRWPGSRRSEPRADPA